MRAHFSVEFGDNKYIEEEPPRKPFLIRVYSLLTLFIFLGVGQWLLVALWVDLRHFTREHMHGCVTIFGFGMLIFLVFALNTALRRFEILNCFIAFFVLEASILFGVALSAYSDWLNVLLASVLGALVLVVGIVVGALLPYEFTEPLDFVIMAAFILIISTVFSLLFYLLSIAYPALYVLIGILSVIMILFIMYHSQCIDGDFNYVLSPKDALLGSLVLFEDFMCLYFLYFVLFVHINKILN